MVRNEKAKTAALVLTAGVFVISLLCHDMTALDVAVCEDASVPARLSYSFFHASAVHALINCWCLLSVVFIYDVSITYLFIAYAIAVCFPVNTLSAIFPIAGEPTVGLSAVCFALFGMVFFQLKRKLYFTAWLLSLITIGCVLPPLCSLVGISVTYPNSIIHIYSYVVGLFVGFLNSPASWIRK